ncbi:NfeD family protein [Amphiplicatus metriothermophilus]|uniref:NfeD-like C-terminal, partner-binding n=1 Tax=Amphiplicatus metriothermophilus TaxID=1519374 RepID=A0A239PKW5_9PROT|nr:NfeD family protein [Amphiplicatus metriothermophilus]MBB5517717.1 membrane protein implicated in regulation of membrane protease activity [Amphiplicatus metriothermophilus]SNT67949.1 NfeD-like C-terminal, partner-binding [Amphiplicatus metriothermophilus]
MVEGGVAALPAIAWAAGVVCAGAILFLAVVLGWGAALGGESGDHRIADEWGGERVTVTEWSGAEGYVRAGGELWRARAAAPLAPGEEVEVVRRAGLVLEVRKTNRES